MAPKAKFLFEQDFAPGASQAEKAVAAAEHALKLAEAESQGFRNGFDAAGTGRPLGRRRAAPRPPSSRSAARSSASPAASPRPSSGSRRRPSSLRSRSPGSSRRSWCSASRSPRSRRLPTECFRQLPPRRTSWCASTTRCTKPPRAQLEEIARTRGFDGRLVVVAEPEIAVGDCKIEWADGGVVRDMAETEQSHRHRRRTLSRRTANRPCCLSLERSHE